MGVRHVRFTLSAIGLWICAPLCAQVTRQMSVDSNGVPGIASSESTAMTPDGRFVAFGSQSTNLVAGDTVLTWSIYVHDRITGVTERVSRGAGGAQANSVSFHPSISADGRFVAFESYASDIVGGDTNGHADVFVFDRQNGTSERVSVDSAGGQGNDESLGALISADGRFVAFSSLATNLVSASDTNSDWDAFVRDRQLGTTERVSVNSAGIQGNDGTGAGAISADGRFVMLGSRATNYVTPDLNPWDDVFVRDRLLGTTEIVSISTGGSQSTGFSYGDSMSPDGRYVVFESDATGLVAGDTNAATDIFVRDRQLGTTERVNVGPGGVQANSYSGPAAISPDGRYVTFTSDATNLVAGDSNNRIDVFLRDRLSGTTELVSLSSSGAQGNDNSGVHALSPISADGRFVAFQSSAGNLSQGDFNTVDDIFLRDRSASGFTSLCDPGAGGVVSCPCSNPPSGPGRGCDNSSSTGGAALSASGIGYLSMESLVFTTQGEKPTATSILLQGTSSPAAGVVYGQGVRCVGGALKRLFTKTASGGSVTVPDFGSGDPTVSARSAARGDVILAGQSRWYLVYYRDPTVLGGCPASSTFNSTQSGQVAWSP
jgi:Tol biopolymer transport system component